MQFTSTIIVALLAVSTSPVTTAQKFSNLRGGGGHKLHHAETVLADPSLTEVEKTYNPPVDAQNDGCLRSDSHYKDSDDECPGDEIMCFDINPPIYMRYCHSPTHPAVCDNGNDRAQDRDSQCATGEIMCHYESDMINTFYCHKF